jgi:hypothetical protein
MPITLIATCPLCGLRFTNRPLLELHIREDHVRPPVQDRQADSPAPADRATGTSARDHPEPGTEKE